MKKITVNASRVYDIHIGDGLLGEAGALVRDAVAGGHVAAIISDDIVWGLYGKRLAETLEGSGYRVVEYVISHGEIFKNGDNFLRILNFLALKKLARTDVVVALGGGVVGDLAGFVAASYMRGVPFVQIPTTLVAAVDSSVGGKTAINLAAGKNLAGAFYQPNIVICDTSLLSTLTQQAFREGCTEVIKTGALGDATLFESLETPIKQQLEGVIARCVEIKRDIVTQDEFETGNRKLLNYGHTVGHAIELLSGYETPHGYAVAAGMAIVTRAAARLGICGEDCLQSVLRMLRLYGLPENTDYDAESLAEACLSDKKRDGQSLTMVFPARIGECILKKVPACELEGIISMGLEEM
ncbi:MAG: 3-dehydroquinate synthase [Clostridiales bacterium]|nr:3-dehydroquinate synthase [Clostridiales bacterium]